jgi:NitT/TauT family transport system substrate-binding protein
LEVNKKAMKKLIVIMLVAVLCIGILAGCNKNTDKTVIQLNEVTHSVFYAPLYVAINKGYFAEENIEIVLTNGGGSDKTMTAILSGAADIGLLGPETAVYVYAGGSTNHAVVFGQLTQKDGSFLVGRTAKPDFKWADLEGSEIIGGRPGGMPAMCLEYALYKNGLIKGQNVTINYDIQFDLITAAFESGTGDYCTMFEPGASVYEAAGKGAVLASVGAQAGNMPYTCFMATRGFIDRNKDLVTAFMRAIIKGIDFVTNGTDEEIADALVPSFPDTPKSILVSSVAAYKEIGAYKTTPVMSEEEFDNLLNVLLFAGTINEKVPFDKVIDNSIAEGLLK